MKEELIAKAKETYNQIAGLVEKTNVERLRSIETIKDALKDAPEMRIAFVPSDGDISPDRYFTVLREKGYCARYYDDDYVRRTGYNDIQTLPILGVDFIPEDDRVTVALLGKEENDVTVIDITQVENIETILRFICEMAPCFHIN